DLPERIIEEPLDQGVKASIALEDVQRVVLPPVFPNEPVPSLGRLGWPCTDRARQGIAVDDQPVAEKTDAWTERQLIIPDQCVPCDHAQPAASHPRGPR